MSSSRQPTAKVTPNVVNRPNKEPMASTSKAVQSNQAHTVKPNFESIPRNSAKQKDNRGQPTILLPGSIKNPSSVIMSSSRQPTAKVTPNVVNRPNKEPMASTSKAVQSNQAHTVKPNSESIPGNSAKQKDNRGQPTILLPGSIKNPSSVIMSSSRQPTAKVTPNVVNRPNKEPMASTSKAVKSNQAHTVKPNFESIPRNSAKQKDNRGQPTILLPGSIKNSSSVIMSSSRQSTVKLTPTVVNRQNKEPIARTSKVVQSNPTRSHKRKSQSLLIKLLRKKAKKMDQPGQPKPSTAIPTEVEIKWRWTLSRIWCEDLFKSLKDHFECEYSLYTKIGLSKLFLDKLNKEDTKKIIKPESLPMACPKVLVVQITQSVFNSKETKLTLQVKQVKTVGIAQEKEDRKAIFQIWSDLASVLNEISRVGDYLILWGCIKDGFTNLNSDGSHMIELNRPMAFEQSFLILYRHNDEFKIEKDKTGRILNSYEVKNTDVRTVYSTRYQVQPSQDVYIQTLTPVEPFVRENNHYINSQPVNIEQTQKHRQPVPDYFEDREFDDE